MSTNKVHNPILGWVTNEELKEALVEGAVTYRNGVYFVPVEMKMIARDGAGRLMSRPTKVKVVSHKYIDWMVKKGKMKLDA